MYIIKNTILVKFNCVKRQNINYNGDTKFF